MDYLERLNAHPRDAAISFDEPSHVYTIAHDADATYTSATTLIGKLFGNHFDAPVVAAVVAAKPDNDRKKPEYHGKTADQLVAMWNAKGAAASEAGTAMHLDVERFFNGLPTVAHEDALARGLPPPEDSLEMKYFHRFWDKYKAVYVDADDDDDDDAADAVHIEAVEVEDAEEEDAENAVPAAAAIAADCAVHIAVDTDAAALEAVLEAVPEAESVLEAVPVPDAVLDAVPVLEKCGGEQQQKQKKKKVQQQGLVPWRTEQRVYWEEYRIAGSIDMLFRNAATGELEIYDWKRSCKALLPEHDNPRWPKYASAHGLSHLPDNAFWHYAMQLNLYRRILQAKYGTSVSKMCLVVMHPDNADYRRIELPILDAEIDAALAARRREIDGLPEPTDDVDDDDDDSDADRGRRRRRSDAFGGGDTDNDSGSDSDSDSDDRRKKRRS